MIPSLRSDRGIHLSVDVNGAPVISPRPPEVNTVFRIDTRQAAFIENKSARFVCRETHRGGNVTIAFAVNFAIVENCRGLSEDEIDVPFDIAILVVLTAVLCVES